MKKRLFAVTGEHIRTFSSSMPIVADNAMLCAPTDPEAAAA
jgi:hypothetical protein